MRTTNCTRSWRRACGKLPVGGESRRCGGSLVGGSEQRVTPHEAHQGEVALQPRPRPPLIVPQPQLLFAILMEPLDGPPAMGQAHLRLQIHLRQPPGEVPFGLTLVPRPRSYTNEPTARPGHVIMSAMHPHAAHGRGLSARTMSSM